MPAFARQGPPNDTIRIRRTRPSSMNASIPRLLGRRPTQTQNYAARAGVNQPRENPSVPRRVGELPLRVCCLSRATTDDSSKALTGCSRRNPTKSVPNLAAADPPPDVPSEEAFRRSNLVSHRMPLPASGSHWDVLLRSQVRIASRGPPAMLRRQLRQRRARL